MKDPYEGSYQEEARVKWGRTDGYTQLQSKATSMPNVDWVDIQARAEELDNALAEAMKAGVKPGSDEANELAERHRALLSDFFPASHARHVLISAGYVADLGFVSHYNDLAEELAQRLKDVIDANAAAQGVDPKDAQWL